MPTEAHLSKENMSEVLVATEASLTFPSLFFSYIAFEMKTKRPQQLLFVIRLIYIYMTLSEHSSPASNCTEGERGLKSRKKEKRKAISGRSLIE